jgi:hypothetical protein
VAQISAHSILHNFTPGPWQELTRALSPAQLERLCPPSAPDQPPVETTLLPEDETLLAELARDGRASHISTSTSPASWPPYPG